MRDRRQELIPDKVTEAVVHELEAIDVDEQDGISVVADPLRAREHTSELLHEGGAVREVGQ